MKRLSRPWRSSLRREVRRGSRASREASVILLPGRDKLSNLEPRLRPTWRGKDKEEGSTEQAKLDTLSQYHTHEIVYIISLILPYPLCT